jgi:predicted nucleic acid-binding protein
MYLLDTDVFSMTSPVSGLRGAHAERWRDWVRRNEAVLYLSVITIMEVRFGIEKSEAKGARQKAAQLKRWLAVAETAYRARIIPVTVDIAHRAGELLQGAVAGGTTPSSEDAIIAATADVQKLHLLSRNSRDMKALQASWTDPLASLPGDFRQ